MLRCHGDDGIGPVLEPALFLSGCYDFDFTLVFEDVLFSILPCGVFLLLAAWRVAVLRARPVLVRWPLLRASKQVAFTVQAVFQLAQLILQATGRGTRTKSTVAEGIVSLVATLALLVLADLEHGRSSRPSAITQVFLFLTALLSLPRLRTVWLVDGGSLVASLFTVTFVVRIILLILESVLKWRHVAGDPEAIPQEQRHGVFGRVFFWWLMPLFFRGYQRDITMDDLFAIDEDLKGTLLWKRLQKSWNTVDRTKKHPLTAAMFRTFFPELSLALIPRLAHVGFSLTQPYLIHATITYVTFHRRLPEYYGYGLIGAYALVYTGLALASRLWMQVAFRAMTKIRGSLVTTIFRKMLKIRAESTNSSAAMSLMSTDVDRITLTTFMVVHIFPDSVQMVIGLAILGTQLGATAVAPVILGVICIGTAVQLGKLIPPRQRRWMAAIQKRVGITSDIIGAMKGVKVAGLSGKVETQIQGLRSYEMDKSVAFRKLQIATTLLGAAPTLLMPAVTFTVYAVVQKITGRNDFGVAQAFTSLSLLNILVGPTMSLSSAWTQLSSALACLDRIQTFLLKDERDDYRLLMARSESASLATTARSEDKGDEKKRRASDGEPVIKVRGGTFGWKQDPEAATVRDVDLDVLPGTLTLVVGPVASGKSTLLKALLGEARLLSGSVEFTIPEEIAYCGEDAWLLNQSIRENILAFSAYRKDFYDAVVDACQLGEDIRRLPKGDDSIIGSRGISLSGGQKQRVALARAVYNRKAIVILDDVLKGLDADTYAKCFAALLGPGGLLRRDRTAVVLATHNVQLLPHAEQIVVLDESGRIAEKGRFDDLHTGDGYVGSLGLQRAPVAEIETAGLADEVEYEKEEKEAALQEVASVRDAVPADPPGPSRGKRNSDALYSYMRCMGKYSFMAFCALAFCNVGFRSSQPLWLNVWTAANEREPGQNTAFYIGIYILLGVLNVVFLVLQTWTFMIIIVPYSAKLLHKRVLTACMHAPLPFFVVTDTGEIVNRFSQDMTLVDMQLPMSFSQSYSQVLTAVAQIVLTCVGSGWLGLSVPVMLVLLFGLQKFYLRTSRQMRLLDLEAKSPLYSHFISSFSGLTALRAYGWTALAEHDNLVRLDDSQRPFYLLRCVQRWLNMVLNLIVAGLAVLLVGISLRLKASISPGLLGVALTSVMGLGQTLSMLIQSWTQLETSLGAVTRINQFAAQTPKERDGPDRPPADWPDRGAIRIAGLYAKYGEHTVLTDINLDIEPGQKIAVCGRSGSGKSTLISLLLRLYEPAAGKIVIDGVDTQSLQLDALREALVALPQDPMFLAGTVRYNLDPLSRAPDDEILDVLRKTGLQEVIEAKGGLDADLDTDWLSAGQRQLFCLARAVLRRGKILFLDEATSSLDRETEATVDELVRTVFHGWTRIVVAHRLKTIVDFDKVLVLRDGYVMEYDTPATLLARDSQFKMLWDLQEA